MTSKTTRWNIWRSFVTRWSIFLHAGTPFSITRQELLSKVPYDSFGLFYVSVSSLLLLLTDARGRSDSSPVGSNCKRKFQMTFLRKQYITINPRKYQYSSIISQFFGICAWHLWWIKLAKFVGTNILASNKLMTGVQLPP